MQFPDVSVSRKENKHARYRPSEPLSIAVAQHGDRCAFQGRARCTVHRRCTAVGVSSVRVVALFGISRCAASVCTTCRTVIWLTTRLLNHRRHPALFARFDEANSCFAFASAFRVGCARERESARARAHPCTDVCQLMHACVRVIAALSVYAAESLRMSLVTPGVTPGFALTVPGYQHRPPCTTDREAPLCAPNDTCPARETLSHVALLPTLLDLAMILFAPIPS